MKRFYYLGSFGDGQGLVATLAAFYEKERRATRSELMAMLAERARLAFAARGRADAVPVETSEWHHYELPPVPKPPTGDTRALRRWQVDADMVVHDIKFGTHVSGVFAWPQEPEGAALREMVFVLCADAIAVRGDHPDYANDAEVRAVTVRRLDEPAA